MSIRSLSQFPDSLLLRHYVVDGSEAAFGELVRRYQSLVLGAAFRRAADLELARDVAQQVFAVLARKANLLAGRESIAGWLHQATMYETSRILQSETRRSARNQIFGFDQPEFSTDSPDGENTWAILDEAIDCLPFADREAVAMHFFQELSYSEMAAILSLKEAAVRKRVSRALQRLGENLRERGARQTAAALLAGAIAMQNTLVVPAGLAQAALAAAAAGGGSSAFLTLSAVMSKTVVKVAAAVAAAAIVYTIWPSGTSDIAVGKVRTPVLNEALNESPVANAALAASQSGAGAVEQSVFALPASAGGGARRPTGNLALRPLAAVAKPKPGQEEPGRKPKRQVSEEATMEVARTLGRRLGERIKPAGGVIAGTSVVQTDLTQSAGTPIIPATVNPPPLQVPAGLATLTPEVADLLNELPILPDLLRELELVPSNAADFVSTLLNEALSLTPVENLRVRNILETHFVEKIVAGLAGARPEAIAESEWIGNRTAMLSETVTEVAEALPAASAVGDVVESVLTLADLPSQVENEPEASGTLLDPVTDIVETVETVPGVLSGLLKKK